MKANAKKKQVKSKATNKKQLASFKNFNSGTPDTYMSIANTDNDNLALEIEEGGGTIGTSEIYTPKTGLPIVEKEATDYPKVINDPIISEIVIVPLEEGGGIDSMPKKDGTTLEEGVNPNDGLTDPPPPALEVTDVPLTEEPSPTQSKKLWLWLLLAALALVVIIYMSKKK